MLAALPSRLSRALARSAGLRLFRFFSRRLDPSPLPAGALRLRMLRKEEALGYCEDPELDLRRPAVEAAFERGELCAAAFDSGRLAGYCWLAFAPVHHLDGVWVKFGPNAVWTYKSLVRPACRGRGIAGVLYRFADEACRERGRTRSLLCVEAHNTPSIAAGLRSGYAPIGWSGWLRGRNGVRAWYSRAVADEGIRFYTP